MAAAVAAGLVAHPAALAADHGPAARVAVAVLAVAAQAAATAAQRAKLFKTLFAWQHANGRTQVAIRQARLPVGMSNTVEVLELLYARPVQARHREERSDAAIHVCFMPTAIEIATLRST